MIFDVFINGLCVTSEGEEFDGEAEECSVVQMCKISERKLRDKMTN